MTSSNARSRTCVRLPHRRAWPLRRDRGRTRRSHRCCSLGVAARRGPAVPVRRVAGGRAKRPISIDVTQIRFVVSTAITHNRGSCSRLRARREVKISKRTPRPGSVSITLAIGVTCGAPREDWRSVSPCSSCAFSRRSSSPQRSARMASCGTSIRFRIVGEPLPLTHGCSWICSHRRRSIRR